MKTLRKTLLVATALAVLAVPANAGQLRTAMVNNWKVTAWSLENDSTSFSHCAAVSTASSNGVHLLFVVSEEVFAVGLFDVRWQLNPWQTFDVTLNVDNNPPINAKSKAASDHQASIHLPKTDAFYNQLVHGQVLHVATASKQFHLRLTNVDKMLPALLACAKIESDVAGTTNNPFAAAPAPDTSGPTAVRKEESF
jgi:hypothetical protein